MSGRPPPRRPPHTRPARSRPPRTRPARPATAYPATPEALFDVETVRRQFPILSERINGRQLVWLDNAATTQKPQVVIDRLSYYYTHENSNIHRAAHTLAARATDAYEAARATIADFIGAPSSETVVFTRGATEAINLVAQAWGRQNIRDGDEIVISHLEHHANIVPWQQLAEQVGATLKVIPVDDDGQLLLDAYHRSAQRPHPPGRGLARVQHPGHHRAGQRGDRGRRTGPGPGCSSTAPRPSRTCRPTSAAWTPISTCSPGTRCSRPPASGCSTASRNCSKTMPPWQGGGNMIRDVTFERTTYQGPPARFEAGTGSIGDAAALGTALDFVRQIGLPRHHQLRTRPARLRHRGDCRPCPVSA